MLSNLRREGLRKREEKLIQKVFETVVEEDSVNDDIGDGETSKKSNTEPKVVIPKETAMTAIERE